MLSNTCNLSDCVLLVNDVSNDFVRNEAEDNISHEGLFSMTIHI